MYDVMLKTPFTAILSGSSSGGKTVLTRNILYYKKLLFSTIPKKTFLFYRKRQEIYNEMLKMGLVDELIEIEDEMIGEREFEKIVSPYKNLGGSLCIFDDLMEQIDSTNSKIFTKIAHHENCSILFLTQALFVDNKHYRVMSRNATYIIIMKNPRDVAQIKNLSSQMGVDKNLLVEAYREATKRAYSYLFLDFHPTTPDHIRLRSNILPGPSPMCVYLQKNSV
jgi:hypothetical protein